MKIFLRRKEGTVMTINLEKLKVSTIYYIKHGKTFKSKVPSFRNERCYHLMRENSVCTWI